MKRIETTLENLKRDIAHFYQPEKHHFVVMNMVDGKPEVELQWFFCDYAQPCEVTAFCAKTVPDVIIPSISSIVQSAWVSEYELADLMDIQIENTKKGFVLEPDFETGPLRKNK